jgi:hypothetical protein
MTALDNLPVWADALIAAMLLVSAFTALTGSFAGSSSPISTNGCTARPRRRHSAWVAC